MFCCVAFLTGLGVLVPGLSRLWRACAGSACRPCPAGGRRAVRLRYALAAALVVTLVSKASADDPRATRGGMWFDSICSSTPTSRLMTSPFEWLD